ncbi:hypothetical protein KDW60_32295, partial [Burkholderia cenocepacia]|uniref:hypothetical protein n=1 Tax=Burkholderia cenocepacia TaxID=95486 RepID=UPI001B9FB3BF
AELLKQLGRNRRQSRRLGFRFARHKFSLGACYALNTKFLTGPNRVATGNDKDQDKDKDKDMFMVAWHAISREPIRIFVCEA